MAAVIGTELDVSTLAAQVRGEVIQPGDAAYEEARKVYNAMIDKRPALIVRCVDVADVIAGVNFARENGILLAVRCGGHNGAGLGTCDDGIVLDLSPMKGIRSRGSRRSRAAARGATSTTRPTRSGSRRRVGSSPRPGWA
jgi:FAD/FMN-containing dehydrogenase